MPWVLGQVDDGAPPVAPQNPGAAPGAGDGTNTGTTQTPGGADTTPRTGPFGGSTFLFIILAFVLLWVFMLGGQRKEKKKRAAMLAALQKGNKIQTVGGILGTVIEVHDSEVLVKVDENANVRLRFARSSVQSVIEQTSES